MAMCLVTACGGAAKTSSTETPTKPAETTNSASAKPTESKKPEAVKVVLNWFAKHEHGGLYAAEKLNYYKDAGLDVTIEQGGPQVSSIQIVASGKAEFGIAHADQLILARKQGIPIVALATTFQISPQMLMFHKDEPIKTFADVNGRQVFIQQGQPYWEFLKKQFKLDQAKEVAYTGQHVNFINDKKSVSQGFVSGEPFALKQQGVEVNTLLVADAGYKPYGAVIYTTEKYLKEHPDAVKAFIGGTVKGWYYYKDHVSELNAYILEKNPKLSIEELNFGEQMQRDFIFGGDAVTKGVGYMTEERWSQLSDQLVQIGMLDKKPDVKTLFTTDFLPKK
ncbi:myristoyl transferase [Paenibacillus rigui]|uniref:Myristoyl transferase n=2 Tax=Paenibacillus rigui TaxID=554312 RepID=A0A229UXL3_9BACL|nr:myristoyl transferase [Paenibacillus rigui]